MQVFILFLSKISNLIGPVSPGYQSLRTELSVWLIFSPKVFIKQKMKKSPNSTLIKTSTTIMIFIVLQEQPKLCRLTADYLPWTVDRGVSGIDSGIEASVPSIIRRVWVLQNMILNEVATEDCFLKFLFMIFVDHAVKTYLEPSTSLPWNLFPYLHVFSRTFSLIN